MHLILVRHLATSRFAALPAHLFLAAGCVLIVLLELVAPPFIDPRAAAFGARPCPTHHLTTTHQPAAQGCGVTDEQPCKRCHVYGAQRQRNFQLAVAACRAASCDVCVDEVPVHWNENAGTSSDSRTALVLVGAASSEAVCLVWQRTDTARLVPRLVSSTCLLPGACGTTTARNVAHAVDNFRGWAASL